MSFSKVHAGPKMILFFKLPSHGFGPFFVASDRPARLPPPPEVLPNERILAPRGNRFKLRAR